jgi:hypothetical protein
MLLPGRHMLQACGAAARSGSRGLRCGRSSGVLRRRSCLWAHVTVTDVECWWQRRQCGGRRTLSGPERRLGELLEPSYVYTGPELLSMNRKPISFHEVPLCSGTDGNENDVSVTLLPQKRMCFPQTLLSAFSKFSGKATRLPLQNLSTRLLVNVAGNSTHLLREKDAC